MLRVASSPEGYCGDKMNQVPSWVVHLRKVLVKQNPFSFQALSAHFYVGNLHIFAFVFFVNAYNQLY